MSYVFRKYVLFAAMNLPICFLPMTTCLLQCGVDLILTFEIMICNGKHPCMILISALAKTGNTSVFSRYLTNMTDNRAAL